MDRRALVMVAALLQGCTIVGGRVRPVWEPTWSRIDAVESPQEQRGTLRVVVRGPDGGILPSVWVAVTDERGYRVLNVTRQDGTASFAFVPGRVHVDVEFAGFMSHHREVDLVAGKISVLDVFLDYDRRQVLY